ncbi:MAG: hypothetical protein L0154_00675 [Chloroflexi bacterium]|nr:hypothetical protein [Chloroflexota bacterium]
MEMDQFFLAFLNKGATPDKDRDRIEELQAEHLAFQMNLNNQGSSIVHGPQDDPQGYRLGITLFPAQDRTTEDIQAIMEQDRRTQAGHFSIEVIPWYTAKDIIFRNPELGDLTELVPSEFDQYYFVFLLKGPNWTGEPSERLTKLQAEHLAYQRKLHDENYTMVSGPLDDPNPDKNRRGIVLVRAEGKTVEDVIEKMSGDPMVKVDHLAVEVLTWYTGKGILKSYKEV